MLPFLSLPNELMLEVTGNLELQDISALLQTNRRLSTLTGALLTALFRSRSLTHGRRLLYQYASERDLESVKYLIDRGILDFTDPETLLHEAVMSQTVHVLETLLHFGLHPDRKDSNNCTPLGLAARYGRVDYVKVLTVRGDVDVDWENYGYATPLFLAVQYGCEEVVRILAQPGNADLHHFSGRTGGNCLHLAGMRGDIPILRFLLDHMDPNEKDYLGQTALHLAATVGNCLAVEFLLGDKRVDPNPQDYGGKTPFHAAVARQKLATVEILLVHPSVEINRRDRGGETPLHVAVRMDNIDLVRLLLSSLKVDVNLVDGPWRMGNTALHTAIIRSSQEIVQLMLQDSRVNINLANLEGISPVGLAVQFPRLPAIRLLMQHPEFNRILDQSNVKGELDIGHPDFRTRIQKALALVEESGSESDSASEAGKG